MLSLHKDVKGNVNTRAQEACCQGEARRLLVSPEQGPSGSGVSTQAEPTSLKHTQKRRAHGLKGMYSHGMYTHLRPQTQSPPEDPPREPSGPAHVATARVTDPGALPCHVQCLETPFLARNERPRLCKKHHARAAAQWAASRPLAALRKPPRPL